MMSKVRTFFLHPFSCTIKGLKFLYARSRFGEIHWSDRVGKALLITPEYIFMSEHVSIMPNARIEGVSRYNDVAFSPRIEFGENVKIQQGLHLTCANRIVIGPGTAIAAYVTITDVMHPYDDISRPIEAQNLVVSEVYIAEDCKINNGAVILPGVHIGKHVTIGANTVVNKDIPDYSVAVGSPVRIVKRYNFDTACWEKTDNAGNFLKGNE